MLVGIIATLLATPAYQAHGYGLVVIASVVATLLAAVTALSLPKSTPQESTAKESYKKVIHGAVAEVATNHKLIRIIGFGILLATLFGVLDEYASLYIRAAHVGTYLIPVISAAMFAPSIIIGFYAYRFEHLPSSLFVALVVVSGGALFLAGKFLGPLGITSFAAFLLLIKLSEIVYDAKLQHAMSGHTRATVTSINEFGLGIASILAYAAYGVAAHLGGTPLALIAFGVGTAAIGLLLLIFTKGRLFQPR